MLGDLYLMNTLKIWSCDVSEFNTLQTANISVYSVLRINVMVTKNPNQKRKGRGNEREKERKREKGGKRERKKEICDLIPALQSINHAAEVQAQCLKKK